MANVTLNWTHATGIVGQRVFVRPKSGGGWITTSMTPANDLGPTVGSVIYSGAVINTIYQFKVNSICDGGVLSDDSAIGEAVNLLCPTLAHPFITDTTIDVSVSGVPTDIDLVIFRLWDSTYTTLIDSVGVSNTGGTVGHSFTGLNPSTTYILDAQVHVTIHNNGTDDSLVSDVCGATRTVTTAGAGSGGNLTIDATEAGAGQINSLSDVSWFAFSAPTFPVTSANTLVTSHIEYSGALQVNCTTSVGSRIEIYRNGVLYLCVGTALTGTRNYNFGTVNFAETDIVLIKLINADNCP